MLNIRWLSCRSSTLLVQCRPMVEPRIVPRAEHPLSRRDIDPDALKVLYRLRQVDHIAYLVGGSVRDLLLGRRPEGLRHRHVGASVSGQEAVPELLDHRPALPPGARQVRHEGDRGRDVPAAGRGRARRSVQDGVPRARIRTTPRTASTAASTATTRSARPKRTRSGATSPSTRSSTTSPTFSIIDYVGGLDDLRAGIVRSIGDPDVRLREDPVRMLRAVALAARLDFTIEPPVLEAIRTHRHEIAQSSAPRLLEEYYKILRAGAAEKTFRSSPRSACSSRSRPSCTAAPAIRCGARSPPRRVPPAVRGRRPTR